MWSSQIWRGCFFVLSHVTVVTVFFRHLHWSKLFLAVKLNYNPIQKQGLCVYLLISTSNHNLMLLGSHKARLYIFWFLHQTTTCGRLLNITNELYIFWFLHQTTTLRLNMEKNLLLYIFWFLHQITTCAENAEAWRCCISFDSYIKPQLEDSISGGSPCCISFDSYIKPQPPLCIKNIINCCISFDSYIKPQPPKCIQNIINVVYLLIPTSNHNNCASPIL